MVDRRRFLTVTSAAVATGLSGCLGVFGGSDDENTGASLSTVNESISPSGASQTFQSRVTPENTGYVTSDAIINEYEEAWTLDVFRGKSITDDSAGVGNVTSAGVFNGDVALFMNGENNMSGYSISGGEETVYTEIGVQEGVQPAVGVGNVFVAGRIKTDSYSGFVGMIDAESYEDKWGVELVSSPSTPVTLGSAYIFVGDSDGNLHRLPVTGDRAGSWSRNAGAFFDTAEETTGNTSTNTTTSKRNVTTNNRSRSELNHTIAVDRSRVYAVTDDRIWCHDISDGSGKWVADAPADITSSPVVGPSRVYVPTRKGVTTYSKESGDVLQDVSLGSCVGIVISPYGVVVFTAGDSEQIQLFGSDDDGVTYRASITQTITAEPTISDTTAYIPTDSGVVAYNIQNQTTSWSYPTDFPVKHSVTTNGSTIIVPVGGVLRCLRDPDVE